jgi:VanZ family protein
LLRQQRALSAIRTEDALAKCLMIDECQAMRAIPLLRLFRLLTWFCVILLAILSLLPADEMVRTGLPGKLEHFIAYAGSAAIAVAGYGRSRGNMRIIVLFWIYAGTLEYLQHFSPGRHPSIADFAASALGAPCGGLAVAFAWRRLINMLQHQRSQSLGR